MDLLGPQVHSGQLSPQGQEKNSVNGISSQARGWDTMGAKISLLKKLRKSVLHVNTTLFILWSSS